MKSNEIWTILKQTETVNGNVENLSNSDKMTIVSLLLLL